MGRPKQKSGLSLDPTLPSSPSPPRPPSNGRYSMDSLLYSRTSGSMVTSHLPWPQHSKRNTTKVDLPIFKSTDDNAEVTYNNWHFDVQQHWLNHTDESLFSHVY